MGAMPNLQPYDLIPHILQAEAMPRSQYCGQLCQAGKCPVIGSFDPPTKYVETQIFRDPQETHRLFVVMDFPDADPNAFWRSPKGKMLVSLLHQQRPAGTSIAIGYMTKCRPATIQGQGNRARPVVTQEGAQYCSSHLFDEIDRFQADAVLLLGGETSKMFLGDGLHGTFGKANWLPYLKSHPERKIPVIATVSPDTVARTPYQGAALRVCIAKAMFWMRNGHERFQQWQQRASVWLAPPTDEGIDHFEQIVEQIINEPAYKYIVFDTETESLLKSKNRLFSFGFSVHPEFAYAIDVDHPRSLWTPEQKQRILSIINRLMTLKDRSYIAHNSNFDLGIMSITAGIRVRNLDFDTQAMAHALDEEFQSKEYKEYVSNKYIHQWQGLDPQIEFWTEFDDHGWRNMKKMRAELAALTTEKVNEYCALDCANTMRVFYALSDALSIKSPTAYASMHKVIRKIDYVLSHIEEQGIPVDFEAITYHLDASHSDSAMANLNRLEKEFLALPRVKLLNEKLVGGQKKGFLFKAPNLVNLSSPEHISTLFYDIIGYEPVEVYNKKKQEKELKKPCDKDFLQEIVDEKWDGHEEAAKLLEYRQYGKLIGTFLTGFRENAALHPDNRVRARYRETKTVTHRLSASDPNTQQIPRGGEANKAKGFVKEVIRVKKGRALVGADYGTAEVRVGAIASGDELLAETFNNAENLKQAFLKKPMIEAFEKWKFEGDAHRSNAAAAYGVPIRQVTGNQRQAAKNVSFLCVYSANPAPQLASKINSSVEEAQEVVDGFLGKFVKLRAYLKSRDWIAENYGLIHTPLGRTRSLYAAMFPENKKEYSHAINQARNTGIQSSASDLLLLTLYEVVCYIEDNDKDWKIVNVVHDSVLADVPVEEAFEFGKVLMDAMENPPLDDFGLDPNFCAMSSDLEVGHSYADQVAWDGTSQHNSRIMTWLKGDAGSVGSGKGSGPESYFSDYLSALGKVEGARSKGVTGEELEKLESKLDSLVKDIERDYTDKVEEALA